MTLPLQDKFFISTRPEGSSEELISLLNYEGATVLQLPLIEIKPTQITEKEKLYFTIPKQFQWIVFTSPNGVKFFFETLKEQTGSYELPEEIQFAVIGSKTKNILQEYGYKASFINPGLTAEDFSEPFLQHIKTGGTWPKILLPLGNLARTVIQDHLKDVAQCIRLNVYETVAPQQLDVNIIQRVRENKYDMILFTSPSGIQNFLKAYPEASKENIRMACIGPVTSREAKINGFYPLVTAQNSSAKGIVDSILNYYISEL